MTITGKLHWDEGPLSASNSSSKGTLNYFLYSDDPDNDDRGSALLWLAENAPGDLFGLIQDTFDVKNRVADNDDPDAPMWDGAVKYKNRGSRKPKELQENTDPAGGPQPVRLSVRSGTGGSLQRTSSIKFLEEVHAGPSNTWLWGGDAKINRLLNLQADESGESASMFIAKGIGIPIGTVEIVVETIRPNQSVQVDGYLVQAALLAGKNVTNKLDYRGFPIRSLKFISFDSTQRGGDEGATDENTEGWDATFVFAFAPETKADKIVLAPGLEGRGPFLEDKRGWDYMDTLYVAEPYTHSGGATFVIPQAKRQSIHQIYDEEDFAETLQI